MGDQEHISNESIENLSSEILKMTMAIREYYPELYQFLEEMPVPTPIEGDSEVTRIQLKNYSESLNSLLSRYILEHTINSK